MPTRSDVFGANTDANDGMPIGQEFRGEGTFAASDAGKLIVYDTLDRKMQCFGTWCSTVLAALSVGEWRTLTEDSDPATTELAAVAQARKKGGP